MECKKKEVVIALIEFTSQERETIKKIHILYTINSYTCLNYRLPEGERIKALYLLLFYCKLFKSDFCKNQTCQQKDIAFAWLGSFQSTYNCEI